MLTMQNKVYIIIFNIPQTVYIRYTTFWNFSKLLFENAVGFANFAFYQTSTPVMRTMLTMVNVVQIIISDIAQTVYIKFTMFQKFRNCRLFCTFWLLRNLYSGDACDSNYAKHSLNHHFRHSANRLYQIYSILKLFQIAVCFAHFGFYEISTPVMHTIPIIGNFV